MVKVTEIPPPPPPPSFSGLTWTQESVTSSVFWLWVYISNCMKPNKTSSLIYFYFEDLINIIIKLLIQFLDFLAQFSSLGSDKGRAANSHGFAMWHTLLHVFTRSHATHQISHGKKKSDFGPRRVRSFSNSPTVDSAKERICNAGFTPGAWSAAPRQGKPGASPPPC